MKRWRHVIIQVSSFAVLPKHNINTYTPKEVRRLFRRHNKYSNYIIKTSPCREKKLPPQPVLLNCHEDEDE